MLHTVIALIILKIDCTRRYSCNFFHFFLSLFINIYALDVDIDCGLQFSQSGVLILKLTRAADALSRINRAIDYKFWQTRQVHPRVILSAAFDSDNITGTRSNVAHWHPEATLGASA